MPLDLFQKIPIIGVGSDSNMSFGPAGSDQGNPQDQMIHLLEQTVGPGLQSVRSPAASNAVPPLVATPIDAVEDGAFWALSTPLDFVASTLMISDVTDISGVEKSAHFAVLTTYGGITTMS